MFYSVKDGKAYGIDDVNKFEIVDNEGNVREEINVEHDTRSLLQLVETGISPDYSYMPTSTRAMSQAVALDIQANSGAYGLMKLFAGAVGGFIGAGLTTPAGGSGAVPGTGIGLMLAEAGLETYAIGKAWLNKSDPKEFWNQYVSNLKEVSEDNGLMEFLDGMGMGSSLFARGGAESLNADWGDVLNQGGSYTAGNIVGNLVKSVATVSAFGAGGEMTWSQTSTGLIADMSATDGLEAVSQALGSNKEVTSALGLGVINALASGVTGTMTLKALPYLATQYIPKVANMYYSNAIVHRGANGAENLGYYLARQGIVGVATGEDVEIDPIVAATMFGLGAGLSGNVGKMKPNAPEVDATNAIKPAYTFMPSEKQPLLLEYKQADLRSLPNEVFDNTAKPLTASEQLNIARALVYRDRQQLRIDPTKDAFLKRLEQHYHYAKDLYPNRQDIEGVAVKYQNKNPMVMWDDNININVGVPVDKMSKAAIRVVMERIAKLRKLGIVTNEQDATMMSRLVYEQAQKLSKTGEVGNYEVRKAINLMDEQFVSGVGDMATREAMMRIEGGLQ